MALCGSLFGAEHVRDRGFVQTMYMNDCLDPVKLPECRALNLENAYKVRLESEDLEIRPYYVTNYSIDDNVRLPNKQVVPRSASGVFVTDGYTGDVIAKGKTAISLSKKENTRISRDILSIMPSRTRLPGDMVTRPGHLVSKRSVDSKLLSQIIKKHTKSIMYLGEVPKGGDVFEAFCSYEYRPKRKDVWMETVQVNVPVYNAVFRSRSATYKRRALPASGTMLVDEIGVCRHRVMKKPTIAVCDKCGAARCESHIYRYGRGRFYCEEHARPEDVEARRRSTLTGKIEKHVEKGAAPVTRTVQKVLDKMRRKDRGRAARRRDG